MALSSPRGYAGDAGRFRKNAAMKIPSILALTLALGACLARAQMAGDPMMVNAMESATPPTRQGPPPAGERTQPDLLQNRDFLVNDRDRAVALVDYPAGTP